MKYFDEKKMEPVRRDFEKSVMKWPGVVSRPMMGCLCYLYNRKFIGILVTDGIIIMKLAEEDQARLKREFGGKPFEMAGKTGRMWVTPLRSTADVRKVMPFVKKRYEEISAKS